MSTELDKLNRLRINAGKNPLKSWKASQDSLQVQIEKFEADGFTDALPGANIDAKPETTDPEIAANLESEPPKPLSESAMGKNIANDTPKTAPATQKVKAHLARGLDTDSYAAQSRLAVRMQREGEKKEAKKTRDETKARVEAEKKAEPKVKLSKADKKQIADEAADRKIAGKVDPKVDPDKAKRQIEKVDAKKAARDAKPKKETNDAEITVAELARELDIDPKVARAKMRRYEGKPGYPKTVKGERWTFPKAAKAEVVKILSGSK